ncbi:MAG TPA: hypothetical protein H9966_01390 [Candidatus Prevotella avicola]|uniref:Uncharacterized protein n=1 Tax=Candidatus Prevotella avicola TaxID=2838738 RepID=A0A9D2FXD2_9BACT|nr:hypothetical protein [Candidatus Prevotella avicola]
MNNLRDALRTFDRTVDESYYTANASGSNDKLEELFAELARVIIYGGNLRINNKFDIYVRSVEFYFHTEEKGHGNGFVRDPVMFHRSSMEGKYRASALIKSFNVNVVDGHDESFAWEGKDVDKDWASSYIYDYIQFEERRGAEPNGDIHVEWIGDDGCPSDAKLSARCQRIGICKYKVENGVLAKTSEKDDRPWRFYRAEPYNKLSRLLDARKH